MAKFKLNDKVRVIAGDYRGNTGVVKLVGNDGSYAVQIDCDPVEWGILMASGMELNVCRKCGQPKEESRPASHLCRTCDHGGARFKVGDRVRRGSYCGVVQSVSGNGIMLTMQYDGSMSTFTAPVEDFTHEAAQFKAGDRVRVAPSALDFYGGCTGTVQDIGVHLDGCPGVVHVATSRLERLYYKVGDRVRTLHDGTGVCKSAEANGYVMVGLDNCAAVRQYAAKELAPKFYGWCPQFKVGDKVTPRSTGSSLYGRCCEVIAALSWGAYDVACGGPPGIRTTCVFYPAELQRWVPPELRSGARVRIISSPMPESAHFVGKVGTVREDADQDGCAQVTVNGRGTVWVDASMVRLEPRSAVLEADLYVKQVDCQTQFSGPAHVEAEFSVLHSTARQDYPPLSRVRLTFTDPAMYKILARSPAAKFKLTLEEV